MQSIAQTLNLNNTNGEVGLEIEVEGRNIAMGVGNLPDWRDEPDGSLKAEESREFVLRNPVPLAEVSRVVRDLYHKNLRKGAGVINSVRAGVHVHLNVQHLTPVQLATALTAYYLLEPTLTTYCGEGRQGNLFCLRLKDAEYPIHYLNDVYSNKRLRDLGTDNIRYAAVNLKAIAQYGSLEFRAMKTPNQYTKVIKWVNMLHNVVFRSVDMFSDPTKVVAALSEMGALNLLTTLVGEEYVGLLDLTNLEEEVYNMVDIVQLFAYGHKWETKVAPTLNIFGTQSEEDW